ncbi:MAG: HAD family hydrolase, partial [Bacilli bacterium]
MPKVLAVDLDGTLFYPKRTKTLISSANLQFIRDFVDAGHRVIIVTSRNREFAELTAAKIDRPVDYVCINGAQIVVDGKTIHDETLAPGRAQEIFADMQGYAEQPLAWFIDSKRFQNLMYSGKTSWFTQMFFKYYYKSQGIYQQSYLADNDIFCSELRKGEIYRILLYFGLGRRRVELAKGVNKHVREKYSGDVEASWINTVVEIAPHQCTKAAALERSSP